MRFECIAAALIALSVAGCAKKQEAPPPAPIPVETTEVIVRDTPVYLEGVGQTLGSQDVEIRARVEGTLEEVLFIEGSYVTNNQLLYVMDRRPMEASVEQVRGSLAQAEAAYDKAQRDVKRLTPLWEKNAVSRQMLDDALAAGRSTKAAVESGKGALENAEIQLGYTRIYAPIAGLIGKTEVKPGNVVGRGANTLLTTISSIDPIHIRFSVSEQDYLAFRRDHPEEESNREKSRDIFELVLSDGSVYPQKGSALFADRNVDVATGTLLLEVSFPNPEHLLRPGQFGRVRVPIKKIPDAILIPQRAIQELQATYSVYVVKPDNTVEFRRITPGARAGNLQVISEGLQPGERVVVEGAQKLQNNAAVAPGEWQGSGEGAANPMAE